MLGPGLCAKLLRYPYCSFITYNYNATLLRPSQGLWGTGGKGHLSQRSRGTEGVQWLSDRVLDSRPRGRGFEPHRRHCVVVLEQDTFILA